MVCATAWALGFALALDDILGFLVRFFLIGGQFVVDFIDHFFFIQRNNQQILQAFILFGILYCR